MRALLIACSVRDIQAVDRVLSKKLNEREKNIKQLIQRHNLWNLREMLDKNSLYNQAKRVRDNYQDIIDIGEFTAQFHTRLMLFKRQSTIAIQENMSLNKNCRQCIPRPCAHYQILCNDFLSVEFVRGLIY